MYEKTTLWLGKNYPERLGEGDFRFKTLGIVPVPISPGWKSIIHGTLDEYLEDFSFSHGE